MVGVRHNILGRHIKLPENECIQRVNWIQAIFQVEISFLTKICGRREWQIQTQGITVELNQKDIELIFIGPIERF